MPGGTNGPPIYDGAEFTHPSKTLEQLRDRLMIRLGYAAQLAAPPPGMTELLNDFLQDAQEQAYKRLTQLPNKRWWTIAVSEGERHYGIPSITTGFSTGFVYAAGPPGTITRATGSFVDDGFKVGMIVTLAGGSNAGVKATISVLTATVMTLEDTTLTASTGESTAVSTVNYITCDYRKIEEAWVKDDNQWYPMEQGINPARFNEVGMGYPQNYEWTDHLEIWPPPDHDYVIYLYGVFGLLPFVDDTDVTTIHPQLVFLLALANAKAHYGQGDTQAYFSEYEMFLRQMIGENHGNKRYIPSRNEPAFPAIKPVATWRP